MRSNAAGVQDVWVVNLKSLQKAFLRAGLRPVIEEIRVGRAVDQAYPVRSNPKKILHVTSGGGGNGDDTVSPQKTPPEAVEAQIFSHARPSVE